MDTDTITEPSGTCCCAVEVTRTETRTYSVTPRDGGGWPAWTVSFTRLARVAPDRTRLVGRAESARPRTVCTDEAVGEVTSSAGTTERPERSLAEFFAEIEDGTGPSLTADDHRALVAAVRSDRERPNDD